jgi:hypothetical protein
MSYEHIDQDTTRPDGIAPPRTEEFTYRWKHIPSNVIGMRTRSFPNAEIFLRQLNKWNAAKPGVWQYWADGMPL